MEAEALRDFAQNARAFDEPLECEIEPAAQHGGQPRRRLDVPRELRFAESFCNRQPTLADLLAIGPHRFAGQRPIAHVEPEREPGA